MRKIILILSFCLFGCFTFADEATSEDKPADPITKTQFLTAQRTLFSQADENYDGQVTQDEIRLLKWEKTKPKYKKAFEALDINNNGFVDYNEVQIKHEELTQNRIENDTKHKEQLLKRYDKDGNGAITTKEINDYYEKKAKKFKDSTEKNAKKDFRIKDTDESGLITLDEYLISKSVFHSLRRPRTNKERPVLTRDSSRDGIITRSENEQFAASVFGVLDKNKDDEISDSEQSDRAYTLSQSFNAGMLYFSSRANASGIIVPK